MKVLQGSAFRAICSIIVGALLVKYREQTVTWITIAMGVLFFLSGLISCLIYFSQKRHADDPQLFDANGNQILGTKPQFPIAGIGSIILGIVLAMMPATFITGLMYVLAAILIVGALNQFFTLASATRFARIGLVWWLMPCWHNSRSATFHNSQCSIVRHWLVYDALWYDRMYQRHKDI